MCMHTTILTVIQSDVCMIRLGAVLGTGDFLNNPSIRLKLICSFFFTQDGENVGARERRRGVLDSLSESHVETGGGRAKEREGGGR